MKTKSLKQSFFIISALFLCAGLLLSALSFLLCVNLRSGMQSVPRYEISLNGEGAGPTVSSGQTSSGVGPERVGNAQAAALEVLQFVLPVFFVALSLACADMAFYHLKLKKPLDMLERGAARIRRQDLDFSMQPCAQDELGALCGAFEAMRLALLNNNRELWRQMEERKRLNAAFAHNLRNPVTVLKGAAKLLRKGLERRALSEENAGETIALIAQYTARIETYIKAMTGAQRLEELTCVPRAADWREVCAALEHGMSLLGGPLRITCRGSGSLWVDQALVQDVAENLVCNALRYAKSAVTVDAVLEDGRLTLTVSDDGPGYPPAILLKGAAPFLRGGGPGGDGHFGMGLYVCRLLCTKHGGSLTLENTETGARASASFRVIKP